MMRAEASDQPPHRVPSPALCCNVLLIASGLWFLHSTLPWDSAAQLQTSLTSSGLNTGIGPPTTLPNGKINYDITGGTRPGNGPNLFHSFGEFSIGVRDIATFSNTTPTLTTANILSRVTGGAASIIHGTIDTVSYPGANLFLINPAGVVFGPTADLNVGGSVNVSTADYLKLADGVQFNAISARRMPCSAWRLWRHRARSRSIAAR
jgi:filamentous hemagglutinin family protein